MSGIYQIRNILNDKVYVGSAKSFERRWYFHKNDLRKGQHHSTHLQRAWDKYGESAFAFEILERVEELTILHEREQHWIDEKKSFVDDCGYNGCRFADSVGRGQTNEKHPRSKLTWALVAEIRRIYNENTASTVYTLAEQFSISPSHIQKVVNNVAWIDSDYTLREDRKQISNVIRASKSVGKNNPMYGKKHTEETRKKISEARLKKP